jgi:uncharacterized DUF497 family protein
METAPNFVIERLVIEDDRPTHIARHNTTIDEVLEVLIGDYIVGQGKHGRHIVIGKTQQLRFLAVVLGERETPGTYGLITARPAHRSERKAYAQIFKGGDEHD